MNALPSATASWQMPVSRSCAQCRRLGQMRQLSSTASPAARPAKVQPQAGGSGPSTTAAADPAIIQKELTNLLTARDYSSYLAHYFYPRRLQRHYLALRAFNAELASIKESVSSEILGRIRIGWWRDAIRGCYQGRPPKHPVAIAINEAIWDEEVKANGGLVEDHFQRIIQAREDDLSTPLTPPRLEDMEAYAEATSSRLFYLSLNLLGVDSRPIDEVFSHLGKAAGLSLQLASIPFHAGFGGPNVQKIQGPPQEVGQGTAAASAGGAADSAATNSASTRSAARRLILPHEHLLKHKVVEEDVFRNGGQAKGLKDAVFDTATRANDYLITARTMIKEELGGKMPGRATGPLVAAVSGTRRASFHCTCDRLHLLLLTHALPSVTGTGPSPLPPRAARSARLRRLPPGAASVCPRPRPQDELGHVAREPTGHGVEQTD